MRRAVTEDAITENLKNILTLTAQSTIAVYILIWDFVIDLRSK